MNKSILVGRLTADPELRYVGEDLPLATFTLAVDKFVNGEKKADFIRCKVLGKQAESIAEYQSKGSLIGVEGCIETGSYEKEDGEKRYTFEVKCDKIEYLSSKKTEEPKKEEPKKNQNRYQKK